MYVHYPDGQGSPAKATVFIFGNSSSSRVPRIVGVAMIVSTCYRYLSFQVEVYHTGDYLSQRVIPVGSPDTQRSAIHQGTQDFPCS